MKRKTIIWTVIVITIIMSAFFPFSTFPVTYRVESEPRLDSFLFLLCKTNIRVSAGNGETRIVSPLGDFTHLRPGQTFTTILGQRLSWKDGGSSRNEVPRKYIPPAPNRGIPPAGSGLQGF